MSSVPFLDDLGSESRQRPNPLSFLWLELTRQCNLECTHCYEASSPRLPLFGNMATEDWVKVLREAAELGVKMIQFIGGEPTLHPDLGQLIQLATELGIQTEVYTNGTRISKELWQLFTDNHVALAFSYYSSKASQHDAVTTRHGSHKKTRDAIKHAVKMGLKVRVGVIQMPNGHEEETITTIKEMRELGIKTVGHDRTRSFGRGVIDLAATRNPYKELCGSCGNGKLAIDANGHVHPCVFSKFKQLGTVHDGLRSLKDGWPLNDFLTDLYKEHPERDPARDPQPLKVVDCNPDDPCRPDTKCGPHCEPRVDCSP